MALTVTAADWVRIASGAFMGVLAVVLIWLGARRGNPTATGVGMVMVGAAIVGVLTNFTSDDPRANLGSGIAGTLGPIVSVIGIILLMRLTATPRAALVGCVIALLLGGIAGIATQWVGFDDLTRDLFAGTPAIATNVFAVFALVLALMWSRTGIPGVDARHGPLLVAAIIAWPFVYTTDLSGWSSAFWIAETLRAQIGWILSTIVPGLVALGVVFAWAGRPGGVWIAFVVPVLAAALMVAFELFGDIGSLGIARLFGVALLAHLLFRADALHLGLRPKTMQRGAAASLFLAVLLIVAQVAQNFLSAQYGLVMGGVVAGAFLFAAQPIQRAIEAARAPAPAPASGSASDEGQRIYRDAVRRALRDRTVTREEEIHLAELAREMRLDPADALRIRHGVEDEAR